MLPATGRRREPAQRGPLLAGDFSPLCDGGVAEFEVGRMAKAKGKVATGRAAKVSADLTPALAERAA